MPKYYREGVFNATDDSHQGRINFDKSISDKENPIPADKLK